MSNVRGGNGAGGADLAAFVAEAWPSLVRTGFLLTGSRAAAEDLVQESLLRCLGPWRRSGPPAQALAYVRTAMVRQALRWRKARRAYGSGQPTAVEPTSPDATMDYLETDAVRRALRALPMDQRAVLVLRFYDGFTVDEIADALRIAPGTVKSRTSRALAALRSGGLLAPETHDINDLKAPLAENDLPDREVSRLLSLTADRVGRSRAPDPDGLVRRAERRDRARRTGAVAVSWSGPGRSRPSARSCRTVAPSRGRPTVSCWRPTSGTQPPTPSSVTSRPGSYGSADAQS